MSNFHPVDSAEAWMRRTDKEIGRLKRRRRHGLTSTSITLPPGLEGTSAEGGVGSVTFIWDGRVEEGRELPLNFHYVEVYASTTDVITPSEDTLIGVITTAEGGRVTADLGMGTWHLAGRIRNTSRAVGPMSAAHVAIPTEGEGGALGPAPLAPTGVNASTTLYWDLRLGWRARLDVSWTPVTQRVDGTPVTPTYRVLMAREDLPEHWQDIGTTDGTSVRELGLAVGVEHCIVVIAEAPVSEPSARSAQACVTQAGDAGAPAQPNPPAMSVVAGMVVGQWDRVNQPVDLARVEFHRSTSAGFTPSVSTWVAETTTGTPVAMPAQPENIEHFYKLVVVDAEGLLSPPSDASDPVVVDSMVSPGDLQNLQDQLDDAAQWIADTGATLETLLSGPGVIPEAVIDHLWANVVRARKITADMMIVGGGENMVPDPHLTSEELNLARRTGSTPTLGWSIVPLDGLDPASEKVAQVGTGTTRTWRWLASPGTTSEDKVYPVTPGHPYRVRYDVRRLGTSTTVAARPAIAWLSADGVLTTVFPRVSTIPVGVEWTTDEVEWTAPADAVGAWLEVVITGGTTLTTAQVRRPNIVSKINASLIVDGVIAGRHVEAESVAAEIGEFVLVEAQNILGGTINAAIEIGTTGVIYASNPDGTTTQMTGSGIEHWAPGGVDEPAILISRFGRDVQLFVPGADGGVFGVNEVGDGAVRGLSTEHDPRIAGTPLLGTLASRLDEVDLDTDLGHLDALPFSGNTASITRGTSDYPWNTSGEKVVLEVTREQQAGRAVLVIVSGKIRFAVADLLNAVRIYVRKTELDLPTTVQPPRPMTSSPLYGDEILSSPHHASFALPIGPLHRPARSELARWLVTVANISGQSDLRFRVEGMRITFLDLGPMNEVALDPVDRVSYDAQPDPPVVTPKKQYTSRWYASTISRAQGSVPTSPSDRAGQALQGWHTTFNGNPFHSILGFTGQAHFGESGRTLNAALAGATVDKVRIRLTMANTYPGTPGRLGIQASSSAVPTPIQNTAVMTNGQTLYTIMDAPFRTGLANGMRYITLGPGPALAHSYAAFHGTSGGNAARVELEVTYTR